MTSDETLRELLVESDRMGWPFRLLDDLSKKSTTFFVWPSGALWHRLEDLLQYTCANRQCQAVVLYPLDEQHHDILATDLCPGCAAQRSNRGPVHRPANCPNCHGKDWLPIEDLPVGEPFIIKATRRSRLRLRQVLCLSCRHNFLWEYDYVSRGAHGFNQRCPFCMSPRFRVDAYLDYAGQSGAQLWGALDVAECKQCLHTFRIQKPLVEALVLYVGDYEPMCGLADVTSRLAQLSLSGVIERILCDQGLRGQLHAAFGVDPPDSHPCRVLRSNLNFVCRQLLSPPPAPAWAPPPIDADAYSAYVLARILDLALHPPHNLNQHDIHVWDGSRWHRFVKPRRR